MPFSKYSPKQKKTRRVAPPRNKITGADFKKLRKKKNGKRESQKPNDPAKWSRAKAKAQAKFKVYPSAYANAWAAKEYKRMGGTWSGADNRVKETCEKQRKRRGGLGKWFDEQWVDVKTGKRGRSGKKDKRGYPACRPKRWQNEFQSLKLERKLDPVG